MSVYQEYDKRGREIYFTLSSNGKKKRLAKSKIGNRKLFLVQETTKFMAKKIEKPDNPSFLHGPISLYYMKHANFPYKIYLLGDRHHKLPDPCPYSINVDDWIHTIVQEGVELDLYLEYYYPVRRGVIDDIINTYLYRHYLLDDHITDVINKFDKSCFHFLKSNCSTKNTRIHAVDFRGMIAEKFPRMETIYVWSNPIFYDQRYSLGVDVSMMKKYVRNNLHLFSKFVDPVETSKAMHDKFVTNKIMKQIDSFPPEREYMGDLLVQLLNYLENEYITKAPRITGEDLAELETFIKGVNNNDEEELRRILLPFSLVIDYFYIHSHFYGDLYLVARLLREYTDANPSYQSIVYMGDAHIQFIKRVLTGLGFYTEYEDINSNQCINITGLELFE